VFFQDVDLGEEALIGNEGGGWKHSDHHGAEIQPTQAP
jgi:hypothetical protein